MEGNSKNMSTLWKMSLFCFCLAGLGGVLFRSLMLGFSGFGWDAENIRHGHSHLMAFGWLTPALFILMTLLISRKNKEIPLRPFKVIIATALVLALLSFPFFTLYGYQVVPFAGFPVSTAISGLNMLSWYAFAGYWFFATRRMKPDPALLFWGGGLIFMLLSSLGAWGISLGQLTQLEALSSPKALAHWFLFLFKEGWSVPALLGLAFASLGVKKIKTRHYGAAVLIFTGLILAVPIGMPAQAMGEIFPYSSRIGAAMAASGMGQCLLELFWWVRLKRRFLWIGPLLFLSFKSAGLLSVGLLPLTGLTTHHGVTLVYLHLMLLGGLTLGLVSCARYAGLPFKRLGLFQISVVWLIASLLPFTPFWPASWMGPWIWTAALVLSAPPVLFAAASLWPQPKIIGTLSPITVYCESEEIGS